jgi:hypothetical protein
MNVRTIRVYYSTLRLRGATAEYHTNLDQNKGLPTRDVIKELKQG